jgi:hypothetical protein
MKKIGERMKSGSTFMVAAFLLLALVVCGPPEARAQWTAPDANGNINNTNPGNVKIGSGAGAPTAVVHAKGNLTSPLTGTVAVTQNSATVTGTGTAFTTELAVGDSLKIGAEVFTVAAIGSATSLTLDSNYLGASSSGATAYRDPNLFAVDNGDGVNKLTVSRSGKVGIGTATPPTLLTLTETNTGPYRGFTVLQYSGDTSSALINFAKHRGTPTAPAALANGDEIGTLLANGYFGTGYLSTASIGFQVNGAVSSTSVPTDIVFRAGTAGATERMRLTSGGNLGVGTAGPVTRMQVGSKIIDDASRVYDANALMVVNQTPTATATLNDPKPVLYLGRQGTSSQAFGAMATFSLSRYENAGPVGVGSRTRLDLALTHDSFSDVNVMTFLSNGNVGVGAVPGFKLDVAGSVNASGLCLGGTCKTDWSQIGGSQWANGSGNINYTGGNVGVGTASPIRGFQISGPNGSGLSEFILENTGMPANNRKLNLWGAAALGASGRFFLRLLNDAGNATTRDFMSFDNATGNVGVGTNAPTSALEVARNQATGTELKVTNADAAGFSGVYLNGGFAQSAGGFLQWNNVTGNNNLFVSTGGAAPLHLGTNNTPRLSVMPTSGNVGVGTTNPGSQLFVGGGTPSVATLPGLNVALGGNSYVAASNGTVNTFIGSDSSPYGMVGTLSNHPLGLRANNALAVTVMPSGNVGVGTAAPAYKLDVTGSVNSTGLCIAGDCKTAWSQVGGGSSQWAGGASSSINYMTGNVGIGTTTPANKLHVVGATRLDGAGRVYIGTTAAQGARGLEIVEETPTTFSIRHHDPWVAWRNIAINPYAGNVGVNTLNPLGPLSVGDSSSDFSDGFIVLGKNNGAGGSRHFRVGFDANFNFVMGDYGNGNVAGTWASPFAINWQAPSNSFYVASSGRVGLGTTSPTATLDVNGDVNVSGNISAKYQDVAEWVPSTQKLRPGTVVVLDSDRTNHVLAATKAYDTKVAGVVSAEPGVILGVGGEDKLKVATTGRVKVRVDATLSPIKVGDLLVTSGTEGVAMKSVEIDLGGAKIHRPGTIIGKALEPLEKGVGEILVLLSLQ